MAILANIFIDQGANFAITVDVTDINGAVLNMAGYTASAQMRKTYSSSTASATFVTSINAAGGQVTLTLDDSVTTTIEPGRYVYDLVATDSGGLSTRVVEGQAIVTPGVTR
jgi:hypothetical protein